MTKKHSPVILFGAGALSMVGSTVLACNATLKLSDLIDEAQKTEMLIHETKNVGREDYTEDDAKKDLKVHKVQTAGKVAKLYAPAAGLAVVGIACLTGSHVILSNRNTAIMAAYAALDKGFREYQNRVRETYGEDAERKIRYDGQKGNFVDLETGKKTPVTGSKREGTHSMYAKLWDEHTSSSYQKSPEYNLAFLTAKQNYLNDRLHARGHVLLNDAYDELGLDRTKEGCVVGWVKGIGDNYIDFGVLNRNDDGQLLDWITGVEGGLWLDFNVDGIVYDKI
jgi:hypothetical protein